MSRKNKNNQQNKQPQLVEENVAVEEVNEETIVSDETPVVGDEVNDTDVNDVVEETNENEKKEEVPGENPVTPEEVKEVPETTVTPEPKQEEKRSLNINDVRELLRKPGITIIDKLEIISKDAIPEIRMLTSKLLGYNEQVGKNAPFKGIEFIAAKNYDLTNTLKQALETKDADMFNIKMDIINLVYKVFAKDGFDEFMLHRAEPEWKWSKQDLNTHQIFSTAFSILCDLATRDQNKKLIDLNKAFNIEEVSLSATAIENIKKYYN